MKRLVQWAMLLLMVAMPNMTLSSTDIGGGGGIKPLSRASQIEIQKWLEKNQTLLDGPSIVDLKNRAHAYREEMSLRSDVAHILFMAQYQLRTLQKIESIPEHILKIDPEHINKFTENLKDSNSINIRLFDNFEAFKNILSSSKDADVVDELIFIYIPSRIKKHTGDLLVHRSNYYSFFKSSKSIEINAKEEKYQIESTAWKKALVVHEALRFAEVDDDEYMNTRLLPWFFSDHFGRQHLDTALVACESATQVFKYRLSQLLSLPIGVGSAPAFKQIYSEIEGAAKISEEAFRIADYIHRHLNVSVGFGSKTSCATSFIDGSNNLEVLRQFEQYFKSDDDKKLSLMEKIEKDYERARRSATFRSPMEPYWEQRREFARKYRSL